MHERHGHERGHRERRTEGFAAFFEGQHHGGPGHHHGGPEGQPGPFAAFFGGRGRHRGGPEGGGGPFGFGPGGFGPPGAGFPWGPFARGHRARRGDIRAGILALLKEGPRNGYQIMQELEQRSQGMWRPSPGSIYPALQQLEDEGLVQPEAAGAGRTFQLTEAGRAYVDAHPDEVAAPWGAPSSAAGDGFLPLVNLMRQVMTAAVQVAQAGTAAQQAEAKKILAVTRRDLYRLLAEDAPEDE
jgi:DNA-binding PadR family transcriptional regulator